MRTGVIKALRLRVLRRMTRFLFPAASRQGLHSYALFSRFNALPELDVEVPGGNVLVLAPHMDDEVFGCGGVLAKHVQAGAQVTVVYMTDGRKGDPSIYGSSYGGSLSEQEIWKAEQDVVARRKCEAQQAASVLGIQNLVFLDFPDGELKSSPQAVEKLRLVLERSRPNRIYLPSLVDYHADHWQTNCVLYEVIHNWGRTWPPFSCWGYEIWPPLFANRVVDISDVIETKKKAIGLFQSQLCHMDYSRGITSLNSYRSFFHNRASGYAEAFFSCSPEDYLTLFKRMRVCRESQWATRASQACDVPSAARG